MIIVSQNGRRVRNSNFDDADDSSLGVFETFLIKNKIPLCLLHHIERLKKSSEILKIKPPKNFYWDALQEELLTLINLDIKGNDSYRCKITLTPRKWQIKIEPYKELSAKIYKKGFEVIHTTHQRKTPQAKYLSSDYAYFEKFKKNADEVIFLNNQNFLREGSITNVFIELDSGKIVTPQKEILLGIMRKQIIEKLTPTQTLEIREIDYEEIQKSAHSIFLTNVIKGVIPVRKWGDWEGTDFSLAQNLGRSL